MDITHDAQLKTLTVTMTDGEDRMFRKIKRVLGPQAVANVLETWLIQQTRAFADQDMTKIRARLDNANAAEIESIKTALNITE